MTEFTILYMSLCRTGQFIIPILNKSKEFEDTNGVIRIRISKKNNNTMTKRKKYKRKNNDLQNINIKLKIE